VFILLLIEFGVNEPNLCLIEKKKKMVFDNNLNFSLYKYKFINRFKQREACNICQKIHLYDLVIVEML